MESQNFGKSKDRQGYHGGAFGLTTDSNGQPKVIQPVNVNKLPKNYQGMTYQEGKTEVQKGPVDI